VNDGVQLCVRKRRKNALEPALQNGSCPTTISRETLAQAKHPEANPKGQTKRNADGVHLLLSTLTEQLPIEDLHHVPSPNPYVSDHIRLHHAES
jgi:hypothetical protein